MIKKYIVLLVIAIALASCKSKSIVVTSKSPSSKPKTYTTKKPIVSSPKKETTYHNSTSKSTSKKADKIVSKALTYKGTRYKYGGTSKSGMDCSGLMFTSFKSAHINLPRTSIAQSNIGKKIKTKDIQKGDLVFFKTSSKNRINHVGLVISVKGRDIKFIHSSSSRGVMISSLKEGYWSQAYAKTQRVLTDFKTTDTPTEIVNVSTAKKHIVKKGDTLYSIARKYPNVSVNDIMKHNQLSSNSIRLGMVLQIPSK